MTSSAVRAAFLDYFKRQGHTVVASSSLVPGNDPTLLFTNAGMVQFKDVFLGQDQRSYKRAVTSQRCVRAGGKHNDLENVGYTARHHTFFEMLGNFSFGDYFKADAIRFAWEFVTQELKIPQERLSVTVFETDEEAFELWQKIAGLAPERITRLGAASNFWAMGDTGPCGPCSEIFYDHGAHIPGGPPGSPDEDGDRFVEIWNLVFMQYERSADGTLTPLPQPSVDTGMGLERISAVMQGVNSNYDIDLFQFLIKASAKAVGASDLKSPSLRVIADHIRACSFLIADGVIPSNEGRGYVLRRIIRRAIRHGFQLGHSTLFFYTLVDALVEVMGEAYPELAAKSAFIQQTLKAEETRFAETIKDGMAILEEAIAHLPQSSKGQIAGETVFKLYDTYGFPVDLTADVARERGLSIDEAGFEREMTAQRERARAASRFGVDMRDGVQLDVKTQFEGYEHSKAEATVVALLDKDNQPVTMLSEGMDGRVVLDCTPFYAESGGQVGDTGALNTVKGVRFQVVDTHKHRDAFVHIGYVAGGTIAVGDRVSAQIDEARRASIRRNHSATHLLHAALRSVLGDHVQQKGSLVEPDRLRFDFSHFEPVTADQLKQIEVLVNAEILKNQASVTRQMHYQEAIDAGAMALFGEKYGETVRVLQLGDFSTELCGGTHVSRTGDIGLFKIISESGVAASVRRIEALSGLGAFAFLAHANELIDRAQVQLKSPREELLQKIEQVLERSKKLEREVSSLKLKLASGGASDADETVAVAGTQLVVKRLDGMDAKSLRVLVDQLKQKIKSGVIVLASNDEHQKTTLLVGVTDDVTARFKAGELAGYVAAQLGGKGGGRSDFAQAGGPDGASLDQALQTIPSWISER
jgi:alanyl-tRNA synthetase